MPNSQVAGRQAGKQKHDRHACGGDNGMGNEIGNSANFQDYNIVSNSEFYFISKKKRYIRVIQ